MSRETSTSEEQESLREVWEEFLLGNKSIADVLAHSEFQKRGMMICYQIMRHTDYDAVDLFVDACVTILESENKFKTKNIPDVKDFFSWFRLSARKIARDKVRKQIQLQRLESLHLAEDAHFSTVIKTRDEADPRRTPAETLAEIAALPLEGETDAFSGSNHDSVLYPRK